jgi:hypothetical protein
MKIWSKTQTNFLPVLKRLVNARDVDRVDSEHVLFAIPNELVFVCRIHVIPIGRLRLRNYRGFGCINVCGERLPRSEKHLNFQ